MVPNWFLSNILTSWQSKLVLTLSLNSTIPIILYVFSIIGLPKFGASLTSKLPERNRRNQKNIGHDTVTVSA